MAEPGDNLQRERIVERTDLSMLVEASAGTGKTTAMVNRLVALVTTPRPGEHEPLRLTDIVAITFTIKAAQELKDRLRSKLHERLARPVGADPAAIAQAIGDLEQAPIGTIHSFCTRILREYPVEAGVDLQFRVAEERKAADILVRTWDDWVTERLNESEPPAELRRLLGLGVRAEHLRAVAMGLLRERAWPVAERLLAERPPEVDWQADLREIDDIVRRFEERDEDLMVACELTRKVGAPTLAKMREWRDRLADAVASGELERTVLADAPVDSDSKAYRLFQEQRARQRLAVGIPLVHFLVRWLADPERGFPKTYERAKLAAGILDFDDLLIRARDLVTRNSDVRDGLRKQYRAIIVDEFQDTDPVQTDLVLTLAAESDREGIVPGRLCVVGDPKQSIYRFRGADIESYSRVAGLIGDGARARLSTNFRSHPALIDAVNAVFRREGVFARDESEASYAPVYAELAARSDFPEAPVGDSARVAWLDDGTRAEKIDDARDHEADMLAARIREICDAGWPVRAPENGEYRAARYDDVAILYRTANHLEPIERSLKTAGVPYTMSGGKSFYRREEVVRLVSVLTAIEQPNDALSVVASLRSAFFGVSDEDLAAVALTDRAGFDYRQMHSAELPEAVADAFVILRRLHELRRAGRPSEVLRRLYDETGVLTAYAAMPDGEQAIANLLKVLDEARALEREGPVPFRRLHDHLRTLRQEGVAEGEAQFEAGEEAGRVHLLTVHAAKGLEFPVVFVVDLAAEPVSNASRGPVELYSLGGTVGDRKSAIAVKVSSGGPRIQSMRFDALKSADADRERAEHVRLLYVAFTRARDYLVLPRAAEAGKGSWQEIIEGAPEADFWQTDAPGSLPDEASSAGVAVETVEDIQAEREDYARSRGEAYTRACEPAVVYGRPSLHEGERDSLHDESPAQGVDVGDREDDAGRKIGTAVHEALERLRPGDADSRVDSVVYSVIESLKSEMSAEITQTIQRLVRRGLESDIVRRAAAAERSWHEVPVVLVKKGPPATVIRGVCDLVFEDSGGLVLADYKTDAEPKRRIHDYIEQMRHYIEALETATGTPVREARLVYLNAPGGVSEVEVPRSEGDQNGV